MNKDNNKEIEVKLLVADFSGLAEKIKVAGGVLLQPEFFQRTWRFDTPNKGLEANKTFLASADWRKNVVTQKEELMVVHWRREVLKKEKRWKQNW